MTVAVLYGAMAAGKTSNFTTNYAKAKMAASHLMMLIKRKSAIDNLSQEGISLVTQTSFFKKSLEKIVQVKVLMVQEHSLSSL